MGTTTVNAIGGIATFTNLVVTGAGSYTLRFDAGSLSIASSTFGITTP